MFSKKELERNITVVRDQTLAEMSTAAAQGSLKVRGK